MPLELLGFYLTFLHPCLTSSESTPKEMTTPPSPLSYQNGVTGNEFCFGLVTAVFKLSQKQLEAHNFQPNHKATKEIVLCTSRGFQTDAGGAQMGSFLEKYKSS